MIIKKIKKKKIDRSQTRTAARSLDFSRLSFMILVTLRKLKGIRTMMTLVTLRIPNINTNTNTNVKVYSKSAQRDQALR